MKHLLILLFLFLLSSPLFGDNHKGETLYQWDNPSGNGYLWKGFGEKDTNPKYQGDVENGVPNGLGFLIFPNGDKYVGEFKDGKIHGQGTYTSPHGTKYVGEFKDGLPNGQGTLTHPDGRKYVGEYKDGKTWNGTGYNKNGEIVVRFVNGEINY